MLSNSNKPANLPSAQIGVNQLVIIRDKLKQEEVRKEDDILRAKQEWGKKLVDTDQQLVRIDERVKILKKNHMWLYEEFERTQSSLDDTMKHARYSINEALNTPGEFATSIIKFGKEIEKRTIESILPRQEWVAKNVTLSREIEEMEQKGRYLITQKSLLGTDFRKAQISLREVLEKLEKCKKKLMYAKKKLLKEKKNDSVPISVGTIVVVDGEQWVSRHENGEFTRLQFDDLPLDILFNVFAMMATDSRGSAINSLFQASKKFVEYGHEWRHSQTGKMYRELEPIMDICEETASSAEKSGIGKTIFNEDNKSDNWCRFQINAEKLSRLLPTHELILDRGCFRLVSEEDYYAFILALVQPQFRSTSCIYREWKSIPFKKLNRMDKRSYEMQIEMIKQIRSVGWVDESESSESSESS
jgi:hypothetical protein